MVVLHLIFFVVVFIVYLLFFSAVGGTCNENLRWFLDNLHQWSTSGCGSHRSLSHYLPLSVQYAVEVGRECDIVEYNKHYYTKAGLIIAGI